MATQRHHPKAEALRMIMKNPKLAKIVREGLKSPIGSFKRKKANDILNSIGTMHMNRARQDGQGGFWDALSSGGQRTGLLPWIGGKVAEASVPVGKFLYSVPGSAVDFTKGMGVQALKGLAGVEGGALGAGQWAASQARTGLLGGTLTPYSQTFGVSKLAEVLPMLDQNEQRSSAQTARIFPDPLMSRVSPFSTSLMQNQSVAPSPFATMPLTPSSKSTTSPFSTSPMQNQSVAPSPFATPPKFSAKAPAVPGIFGASSAPTSTKAPTVPPWGSNISKFTQLAAGTPMESAVKGWKPVETGVVAGKDQFKGAPVPPGGVNANGLQGMADTDPDAFNSYSNTDFSSQGVGSPDANQKFANLEQFILSNKSAGYDAIKGAVFNDPKLLAELMPGVPEEDLPKGALLAEQVLDLYTTLKDEYGLDEQLKKLLAMQKTGALMEDSLNTYVRDKDQYLEKVDKMIYDAKDMIFTKDLSLPGVANDYKRYMDYLNTLRGRQQSRYIDVVKTAVDEYGVKLDSAQDTYNAYKDQFTEELGYQKDITTERYQFLDNVLKNMYDTITGADEDFVKQQELMTRYAKAQKEEAEYLGLSLTPGSKKIPSAAAMTLIDQKLGDVQTKFQVKDSSGAVTLDDKGKPIYITTPGTEDIFGTMAELSQYEGIDPDMVWERYLGKMKDSAIKLGSEGDVYGIINSAAKAAQTMASYVGQEGYSAEDVIPQLVGLKGAIDSGINQGLYSYFNNDAKMGALKSALSDLVGLGGSGLFGWGSNKPKTSADKSKWVNDHKDVGDSKLLGDIFDSYISNVNAGGTPADFYNTDMTEDDIIKSISEALDGIWSQKIFNGMI